MPRCKVHWCRESFVCFSLLRDHEVKVHDMEEEPEDE